MILAYSHLRSTRRLGDYASSSPSTHSEDLDGEIPARPLLEIREEFRYGLERGIEILVEESIRRNLAERPLSLVHLVEQPLERAGRVRQAGGQLGEIGAERVEPLAGLRGVGCAEQRVQVRHHALERRERRLGLLHHGTVARLGEGLHAALRRDERV